MTLLNPLRRSRTALYAMAILLCGQAAFAADTALSTALTACSSTQPAPQAVLDELRSKGWADPDADNLQNLASGLQLGSLLFDHIDGSPEDAAEAQQEFFARSADIIRKTMEKTEPPFDAMNAHILAAPDGTVAELNWSDIGGKLYFTCRISPQASATYDAIAKMVETIFVDTYLERSDTSGSNGAKSVWNDFDNEQIYIYSVNEGVLGPNPLIAVQTLVSPEE